MPSVHRTAGRAAGRSWSISAAAATATATATLTATATAIATAAALCAAAVIAAPAQAADDAAAEAKRFKFTFGSYRSSDDNPARDANLRATQGAFTSWLGVYQDSNGLRQWRSGLEWRGSGDVVRPLLSLQSASGGVLVGAASAELGGDTFAVVGWGRTNLRPYVNLNYDPNDATTLGVGTRAWTGTELSLFQVRDDRLHTGQQVTHAVWRQHLANGQRLTLDVFYKQGLIDSGDRVHATSLSIGWDGASTFVRWAHDPYAGFARPTQNRLSIGFRF